MVHREPVQVVFADVDMMGHVNNAAYFTYFETARTNYLLKLTGARPPFRADMLDFIVARAVCEFRRALRWGERLEVRVWPSRIGDTSFTFSYRIVDAQGGLAAEGETVQVAFDYARGTKRSIAPALRSALETERAAGPDAPLR